ncbi:hypothetical protein KEM52_001440 [Ascosphaera acerosa]|nr:hypothetical protein KEM52_001440 [Ascosphaera acerosa]
MAIKTEEDGRVDPLGLGIDAPGDGATPTTTPSPRKKRPRTKATDNDDDDDDGLASPSPRKKGLKIPSCLEEATEADLTLLRMRDEGRPWCEVNAVWEHMTGEKPGRTTLPNRLVRLKANVTTVPEEDVQRLVDAVAAVDAELERERYGRIAKAVVAAGGGTYDSQVIQKKVKELRGRGLLDR